MTFADMYDESISPALKQRVSIACATAAQQISTEAADTPNHAARVNLANQVARSPSYLNDAFTTLLASEGITTDSTDEEISNMVSAVWNTMAGPSPA